MDIEKTITIDAPCETIWSLLTDEDKILMWNKSLVRSTPVSKGEICKGYRSKAIVKEVGKEVEYDEEIIEFTPSSELSFSMSGGKLGGNPMLVTYILKQTDQGTQLSVRSIWRPCGVVLRLMSPIINRISRKGLNTQLTDIKKLAENR